MKLIQMGSNQTAIWFDNGIEVFFSYNTPVVAFVPGKGYIASSKKYGKTTSKHINAYLTGKEKFEWVAQTTIDNLLTEKLSD